MSSARLKLDEPLKVGDVVLIPMSEVTTFSRVWSGGATFAGLKKPRALMVFTPKGSMVLDLGGDDPSQEGSPQVR